MLPFVGERKQLKIFVTAAAKDVVVDFAQAYGMSEQHVASQLYEWFGRQPLAVRKWIVGMIDGRERQVIDDYVKALGISPTRVDEIAHADPRVKDASAGKREERSAASKRG